MYEEIRAYCRFGLICNSLHAVRGITGKPHCGNPDFAVHRCAADSNDSGRVVGQPETGFWEAGKRGCVRFVGNPDIERQLSALELMNAATIACESTAEIMVQLWSSNSFSVL
jgi:hypothetical protein